jgi:GNAT superfamily N-acetyltransferase
VRRVKTDRRARAAALAFADVDPGGTVARTAMAAYYAEIDARFPAGFDPGDPRPLDRFVVADADGVTAACGGLQRIAPGVDEIKRMWVHPDWRGAGLAGRLLRHLEALAAERGHHAVRLDTNGVLTEAIAMYDRAGYRRIERYNDNPYAELFFEKELSPSAPPE